MSRVGSVALVGAGPGDPKLLTVRAVELLKTAEVLAYDELVSPEILALAPECCERLPVGRRHGTGPTSYRLHPAVMERAKEGKRVVRLKAGDPMIFGRGGEEAEELVGEGIPFEIVPGISAALGAASYAGIPLTHRERSRSVTLTTGHDVDGSHGERPERGTVVLYMGARKLQENLTRLEREGYPAETPAAYIAAATTARQEVVVGTIADLVARVRDVDVSMPAVVIVGDVVGVRAKLQQASRVEGIRS